MNKRHIWCIILALSMFVNKGYGMEKSVPRPYRIMIDQSHDFTFLWDWRMGRSYLRVSEMQYTRNMATIDTISIPDLYKYDALMIPQVWCHAEFLPQEINTIKKFVERGGGLLLVAISENKRLSGDFPIHHVAHEFGVQFKKNTSELKEFKILDHEVTAGVEKYETLGSNFGNIEAPDNWDIFLTDTQENVIGVAGSYGRGRVIVFADHFLINMDSTHNRLLVENIAGWLSANMVGEDPDFVPIERIYPENTLKQGLITYKFSKNLESSIMLLYNNYEKITTYLRQMMSVDCVYSLTILALAGGGGGYSSGDEIGIGLLTSDEYALAVFSHEATHSWQQPGGEPPWMGEGWAVLAAENVLRKYGGRYEIWAQNEFESQIKTFLQYDPGNNRLNLDEYGVDAPIPAYTGKFFKIMEELNTRYGDNLMNRYYLIRRKYYDPKLHGEISTQKVILFLSWAAGTDLFQYFIDKGTKVEPMPISPVVFETSPGDGNILKYRNLDFTITFNSKIKPETLSTNTIKIYGSESGMIDVLMKYDDLRNTVNIHPSINFAPGELVTVDVTSNVQDVNGHNLDGDGSSITGNSTGRSYKFSFLVGNLIN